MKARERKILDQFLNDNNAYDQFYANLQKEWNNWKRFLSDVDAFNVIDSAFRWQLTPESPEFWVELNFEWHKKFDTDYNLEG